MHCAIENQTGSVIDLFIPIPQNRQQFISAAGVFFFYPVRECFAVFLALDLADKLNQV